MTKLKHTLMALVLGWISAACSAQSFPTRPVTIILPYQSGGSIDAIARPLAASLSKAWGQPVIVENRPGANGLVATRAVIKAPADGYTLLYHITGIIQNPLLQRNAAYDPLVDLAPIIQVAEQPMGLAVPGPSPITSLDQLVAEGRTRAKGLSYGSVGVGHTGHIYSETLAADKKMSATHAPYKGVGPLVMDLVGQRLDFAFLPSAEAILRASDHSARILAVTGTRRLKQLPNVATMQELGYPGFTSVGWHGVFAPAATPKPIVAKIEADIRAALAEPELKKVLDLEAAYGTSLGSEEFRKVMQTDQARWATLIKRFDIRAE